MSHRTRHLPPAQGLKHIVRELRYHEASRQLLALALIALWTFTGRPESTLIFNIAMVFALVGMLIRVWASGHVKKNKELATDGPYAYVRHPLYVGNILLLFGFALAAQVWWALPLLVVFVWFYYPTAIDYEDHKLQRLFGAPWEQWSANTRALLPRFAGRRFTVGGWSFKQSLIQNGEPIIVLYVIFCAYYLAALSG
jgi:protein-S-isoprenylcysteine O-methyltransferase Ste14